MQQFERVPSVLGLRVSFCAFTDALVLFIYYPNVIPVVIVACRFFFYERGLALC